MRTSSGDFCQTFRVPKSILLSQYLFLPHFFPPLLIARAVHHSLVASSLAMYCTLVPMTGNTSESALGLLFWGIARTGISAFLGKRKLLSLVSPEVELFPKLSSGFRSSLSISAAVSLTASSVVSIGTISALSEWTSCASPWPSSSASPSKSVPSSLNSAR